MADTSYARSAGLLTGSEPGSTGESRDRHRADAAHAVLEEPAEIALADRLRRRDPAALAELYDRYGRLVYQIALRHVRNQAAAEDLTQETFLALWRRGSDFDPSRGALGGWVAMVARSRVIDYVRSVEFRIASCSSAWEDAGTQLEFRGADEIDRIRMLAGPWRQLKQHERQALRLAHWLGLSQTEIARRLNRPLGTIKTWMRNGHQSLRAALEAGNAD